MIALEIIRFQEQEHPPSGLVTDARCLGRAFRSRQQQAGAAAAPRAHDHPALAAAERRVLAELEIQSAGEEGDRFVIVGDHETNEGKMLVHRPIKRIARSCPSRRRRWAALVLCRMPAYMTAS